MLTTLLTPTLPLCSLAPHSGERVPERERGRVRGGLERRLRDASTAAMPLTRLGAMRLADLSPLARGEVKSL
jgi:hypothetical protein